MYFPGFRSIDLCAGGIGLKTKMYVRTKETEGLLQTAKETAEVLKECPKQYQGFSHYMEHRGGYPTYHNSEAVYYPLGEDKFADILLWREGSCGMLFWRS